jgi:uncharacterized membrane protein (UPF0127 family)
MFFFLAVLLLAGFSVPGGAGERDDLCRLEIVKGNDRYVLRVEVADSPSERRKGLMFRRELPEDRGMLFIFRDDDYRTFWMKNTYLPLDIAFINREGVITGIMSMKPLDTNSRYRSTERVRYVLEVNRDWFSRRNIGTGSRILFHGCIGISNPDISGRTGPSADHSPSR